MTSMIFSKTILRRLDDWLLRHPGKEAWVFFAYNLHVMETGFPEEYAPRSKGLYLVPVFQTPETEDSYHIKGIGFGGRDPSIHLMTVNIRMFREEKVADVITELKGLSAYRSFESLLGRVLDHQCKRRSFLDCSNLLRYPSRDSRAEMIHAWVDRACENRKKWMVPESPSLFSRGGDGVVEATLLEEIGRARTQIDLASHVFNRSKVSDALLEAAARGVRVRVLVGTPIQDGGFQKVLEKSVDLKLQTRREGVTAHAKFAVMDGTRAIWGTGNLTKTSLQNPWEIFLGTEDVKFLKSLTAYFNRFHRSGENPRDPSLRPRPIGDWFEK